MGRVLCLESEGARFNFRICPSGAGIKLILKTLNHVKFTKANRDRPNPKSIEVTIGRQMIPDFNRGQLPSRKHQKETILISTPVIHHGRTSDMNAT